MKIKRFQEGGVAPTQEQAQGAGAQGQPSPEEQLSQMAQQIIQSVGPEAAAMLAQIIVKMLEGAAQQQPEQPQGQPVMARKGTKLVMVGRK